MRTDEASVFARNVFVVCAIIVVLGTFAWALAWQEGRRSTKAIYKEPVFENDTCTVYRVWRYELVEVDLGREIILKVPTEPSIW